MLGFAFVVFTVVWMVVVISGGHNNWDKGQAVGPFATHNVLIAAFAGVWMIPPGLYLLFWPLRTWRRLKRTSYALTDRNALIIAPDLLGRKTTKSFTAENLRLMRVEERPDGTGDVIIACPSTWYGLAETVGFLGIDKARDVEALVRKTLIFPLEPGTVALRTPTAMKAPAAGVRKSYRLSLGIRLFQFVFLVVGVLMALVVIADVILACVLLALGPEWLFGPPAPAFRAFSGMEIAAGIAAGLGSLLMAVVVVGMFLHFALRIPIEIRINDDREVNFRARLRTVTIPVAEITMIQTGRWFDPNRFQLDVVHKRGKLTIINKFSDFTDFLATVRELNPSIEIKGF